MKATREHLFLFPGCCQAETLQCAALTGPSTRSSTPLLGMLTWDYLPATVRLKQPTGLKNVASRLDEESPEGAAYKLPHGGLTHYLSNREKGIGRLEDYRGKHCTLNNEVGQILDSPDSHQQKVKRRRRRTSISH